MPHMGPERDSTRASKGPLAFRWVFGSLRRRFALVLTLLGVVSIVPWYTSLNATQQLHGLAGQIDLAGSLRYRFVELSTAEAHGPASGERLRHLENLIAEQHGVLQTLIDGNPSAGIPPCDSRAVCGRLEAHLARWDNTFAPAALAGSAGTRPGARERALFELRSLDETVHLMAAAAEAQVRSAERANLIACIGVLVLVILVGFGVWDAFSRISNVRRATQAPDAEQQLLEIGAGPDEVAALARTLVKGLREFDQRNEADRARAVALTTQQRAVHALALDLKRWLAGDQALDRALEGLVSCMECEGGWVRSGFERGLPRLLGAAGIDAEVREIIAADRDESPASIHPASALFVAAGLTVQHVTLGPFRTLVSAPLGGTSGDLGTLCLASTDPHFSLSDEQSALIHTFARHVSTAFVAHDLLNERQLREQVATLLATLPGLNQGGGELATLISQVVAHDLALINVVGEGQASGQTWRLDADGARRDDLAWTVDASPIFEGSGVDRALLPTEARRLEGVLIVPLRAGDEQVGSLLLGRADGEFNAHDVEAANAIVPMLASAIARMRLEEMLRLGEQASAFDAFSRMLAHEVRNPLNSMVLHADLLARRLRKIGLQAEQKAPLDDHIAVLRGEIERLNELVEHYLRLTKTGAPARLEPVALQDIVEAVLGVHAPALVEQGIAVEVELPPEPALVMADAARIKQVLHNLIRNSMDAMCDNGPHDLFLALVRVDNWWELRVRDTGHGIPDSAKVFSPSFSTKPTGGGMGLPLSLQIARLHGGALVARRPSGGGAEFVLSLPALDESERAMGSSPTATIAASARS